MLLCEYAFLLMKEAHDATLHNHFCSLSGRHNCISIDYGNLKVMCNHISKTLSLFQTSLWIQWLSRNEAYWIWKLNVKLVPVPARPQCTFSVTFQGEYQKLCCKSQGFSQLNIYAELLSLILRLNLSLQRACQLFVLQEILCEKWKIITSGRLWQGTRISGEWEAGFVLPYYVYKHLYSINLRYVWLTD